MIPPEIRKKYPYKNDVDTDVIVHYFDEPEGSSILEIGAHDEPLALMLADCGHRVTGVDLRTYDRKLPPCNYEYTRMDFCDLPEDLFREWMGSFDCIVSISAIEHFGLGTYEEGRPHAYYDVIAMRTAWQMLKEGGTAYITVPYGPKHIDNPPHWRVYDYKTIHTRLVQDFEVSFAFAVVSGPGVLVAGEPAPVGAMLTRSQVGRVKGNPPHVSAVMKLRKQPRKRLAPDGR